jgi:multidrug efflux pump subunit AcrB
VDPASLLLPQVYLEVDRTALRAQGVSTEDLFNTLQVYLGGANVNDFNQFGRTWQVIVQADAGRGDRVKGIGELKVRNSKGQMVPLKAFVKVREIEGPPALDRLDGKPMVEITANPASGMTPKKVRTLCETLAEEVRKELRLSADYRLAWLHELPATE